MVSTCELRGSGGNGGNGGAGAASVGGLTAGGRPRKGRLCGRRGGACIWFVGLDEMEMGSAI